MGLNNAQARELSVRIGVTGNDRPNSRDMVVELGNKRVTVTPMVGN
jgi:hypothetical protein